MTAFENVMLGMEITKKSCIKSFDLKETPETICAKLEKYCNHQLPQNLIISIEDWYENYLSAQIYHGYVLKVSEAKKILIENNPEIAPHIKTILAPGIYLLDFTDSEGNYVFASDVSFDYDSRTKLLSINYGTCGRFNENNIYQFRRIQLLNKIVTNISMLQSRLNDVAEKASETYIKKIWEGYEIDVQIEAIKASLKKAELIKITQNLTPGQRWHYTEECPGDLRVYRYTYKPLTITRVTPKMVFFTANPDGGTEYRCTKEAFVNHIYKDYLVAVD